MFKKGKWYVNPNWMPKSIMKFSYSIDTKLYFTEAFKEGKYAINDKWWSDSENKTRLATQEEISQYLPDNHPDKIKVTQEKYQIIKLNSQKELEACEKYFDNLGYERTVHSRRKISEGTFFTIYNIIKQYQNLSSDCLYPKITLKDLGINVINTQDEFKVGDWVVWKSSKNNRAYKLIDVNYQNGFKVEYKSSPELGNYPNQDISNVLRKAKLEEIPVKDLSNEEILEIAKQYYPIGTKIKSLFSNRQFQVLNSDIRFENNNQIITVLVDNADTEDGYAAIWDIGGKWAEIISTSQEVKDDFVLPEKWYIIRNKENYRIVNKWENDTYHGGNTYGAYLNDTAYMFSNKKYQSSKTETKGYTEITTEQFKKYVLGEKIENNSVFPTELINKRIEELENSNEIYIPTITKQKKKIDYTINNVFADIKVNLPEKPKKIVKPIVLEKFNLII